MNLQAGGGQQQMMHNHQQQQQQGGADQAAIHALLAQAGLMGGAGGGMRVPSPPTHLMLSATDTPAVVSDPAGSSQGRVRSVTRANRAVA